MIVRRKFHEERGGILEFSADPSVPAVSVAPRGGQIKVVRKGVGFEPSVPSVSTVPRSGQTKVTRKGVGFEPSVPPVSTVPRSGQIKHL